MRALAAVLFVVAASPGAAADAVAAVAEERTHVRLPERKDDRPFSDAVVAGKTIYLSGALGLEASGKPPADAAAEARLVMERLKRTLEAAGGTMDDLVSVQVFCSDIAQYDTFNKVYASFFKAKHPARAFIGSGPLLFGARFEVQAVAVKP
jgi:enamine deaminase RidA (YjgF/YER057c/UK114 family)